MARVPSDSFGQSRYTEQLLQTVLIPTVVSNAGAYTVETDLSATTIHVETVYATNVYSTTAPTIGDITTETLAIGSQSMQGTYVSNLSTTVLGVRAVGNSNARGTFDGNVIVGAEAGLNLCNANYNVYVGAGSGTYGQATSNVVVGYAASTGISGIPPTRGNVILGAGAGANNTGDSNVFIGLNAGSTLTVSNTLVVDSGSGHPLIYGKFDSQRIGINCVPTQNFNVSGNSAISGNLSVSGVITGYLPATNISGFAPDLHGGGDGVYGGVSLISGTISNPGTSYIGGVYLTNSNLSLDGTISNISSSTNYIGGVYLLNSNLSLDGTISNISSSTNYIGGVYLANSNVSLAGTISNVSSSTNYIGGVYLANSNVSLEGTISNISSTTNYIGGVYLHNSNLSLGGRIVNTNTTSNDIGGVLLSNKQIVLGSINTLTASYIQIKDSDTYTRIVIGDEGTNQYRIITCNDTASVCTFSLNSSTGNIANVSDSSNSIGGVILGSGLVNTGGTSVLSNRSSLYSLGLSNVTANNLRQYYFGEVVSGIQLWSNTTNTLDIKNTSGSISNVSSSLNTIGGVYLLNSNLSLGGTISNISSTTNYIGGVYLLNSNLSLGGTISNISSTTNYIGGVYLTNSNLSLGGTISNISSTTNYIGGVYLLNSNLSLGGTISNIPTVKSYIGGVYLSNSNLSLAGTICNISSSTNYIGGVFLSNSKITASEGLITRLNSSNYIGGITLSAQVIYTNGGNINTSNGSIFTVGGGIDLGVGGTISGDGSGLSNVVIPSSNISGLSAGIYQGNIVLGAVRIQWGTVVTSGGVASTTFASMFSSSYLPAIFTQQISNTGAATTPVWITSANWIGFSIAHPGYGENRSYFWTAIGGA